MYKSVLFATSTHYSLPVLTQLKSEGILKKVVLPDTFEEIKNILAPAVGEDICKLIGEKDPLPDHQDYDLVILFAYPHKVPTVEGLKMLNIHFGSLPENRGPEPLFWTLKQEKNLAYIAMHEVSAQYDAGDVLLEKGIDILPGENYGMLWARLAQQLPSYVTELVAGRYEPKPQDPSKAVYYPLPQPKDYTIDWNSMNVNQIQRLVQASNPKYGGALTSLQQSPLRLLDVNPAQVQMEGGQTATPGQIVHASSENGIYVACINDQFLRLNILSLIEGIFTDNRLASMGVPVGAILGS